MSGNAINKLPQLSIVPVSDSSTADLYRAIRNHLPSLIPGLLPSDVSTMQLGLSHSLSRHKLKFSPDKVDTMIVQAIALLDDLDKELNTYAMRVKEWYGWHFPEMARIVNDNLAYARIILKMGMRTTAASSDLAEILPEEIETAVKAAAEISMGTEITEEDLENIKNLAEQVVGFTEYRQQLSSYLSARMAAIAPNLTALVGDLVGARLISHAGSLINLAKSPASTIQILGAEKALFRALKTKHDTPKYGLIYHASLIGQATGKNKGKIARVLAAKAAIGLRVDALSEWGVEGEGDGDMVTEEEKSALGVAARSGIERRLAVLEGRPLRSKGVAIGPNGVSMQPGKWEVKEAKKYNPDADGLAGDEPAAKAVAALLNSSSSKTKGNLIEEVEVVDSKMPDVKDDGDSDESEEEESQETREVVSTPATAITTAKEESSDESEDEADEEMEDAPSAAQVIETITTKASPTFNGIETTITKTTTITTNGDDKSETISTISDDTPHSSPSPTPQERNWQSSIPGNTKDAKKARKKERHARKLALSEERSKAKALRKAKIARRLDRKERRQKRDEQIERRMEREDEVLRPLAKQAGLSVTRYKRKLERGEISFDENGVPTSISKKDIKKREKEARKLEKEETKAEKEKSKAEKKERKAEKEGKLGNGVSNGEEVDGKKRKREREDGEEKSEKKKKKKAKV